MASLEAKISSALTEIHNIRSWLEEEVRERRRDHDEIVEQRERLKTVFETLKKVASQYSLEDVARRVKTLEEKQENRNSENRLRSLEDFKKDYDETKKEQRKARASKAWQIVIMLVGALVTAIIGGVVTKFLF